MAAGGEKERSLESTPSWAVAVVCFLLIAISIAIEQLIHRIETWLKKKRKSSLCEAHGKIKTELMLLGFMSLLLTAAQELISEICIPESVGHSWRPCSKEENDEQYQDPCRRKGKAQFVSLHGINQLHRFIFALAVTHVVCSVTTLGLGGLKIRKWKPWEDETRTVQYQCHNDPERFRFARETTFVRRHLHFWSKSTVLLWIVCFFSQLFTSVAKVDYLTLRHGFITAHLTPQSQLTFNFQKYIKKSLEEDFKVVVGISPVIWLTAVLFLLTDSNGWYSHFWLPFFPLIIILLIGAKFQVIITKMGISILERGDVVKGTPIVQPGDDLFWFSRPRFTLFLIHFVLFQNAFQIAFLAWSSYEFGYPSCYHENLEEIIIRIAMGVLIQVLCSYVTLPLYALVSQMGSSVKPVIFSDQVVSALRAWYLVASKRLKQEQRSESTTPVHGGTSTTPVYGGTTPVHLLHGQRKYNQINKLGSRIGCSSGEGTSASPGHRDMTRNSRHLGDHINKVRIGGGSSGGGEGTSALPGHRDIDKTTRNSRYLIDHINKSRLGGGSGAGGEGTSASPGHSDIDDTTRNSTNLRDYIKKGRIGGGSGGGEGTSASPGHRDIDDTTRNSRNLGKMERGREEYKINQPQLDVEISSRDFSFRHKQNQ